MVKSAWCFCRGLEFSPQAPVLGGSQPPVTPTPRNPAPSSVLHRHCTQYSILRHAYTMNTRTKHRNRANKMIQEVGAHARTYTHTHTHTYTHMNKNSFKATQTKENTVTSSQSHTGEPVVSRQKCLSHPCWGRPLVRSRLPRPRNTHTETILFAILFGQ